MPTFDPQTVQLIFVGVAALALVLQTIFMIVLLIGLSRAVGSLRKELESYRAAITPILEKAREVTENIAPKLQEAADELNNIIKSLQKQTADIRVAADDIIDRTRHQVGRVDAMLTTVFDRVERAGSFMSDAVARPMRQLSGVIASIKAAIESLRSKEAHHSQPPRQSPNPEPIPDPEEEYGADEELYR